jgi:hypothetical protein
MKCGRKNIAAGGVSIVAAMLVFGVAVLRAPHTATARM